jgi:hypothetical protein
MTLVRRDILRYFASGAMAVPALAFLPAAAPAQDGAELVAEHLHSAVPLYSFDWKDMWPRSFHEGDEFGCASRVSFGDWRFVPTDPRPDNEHWSRFSNYGVFHCAAIFRSAEKRDKLDEAKWSYGFFVRLGKARLGSGRWELWALQKGMVPGSEYTLLAREEGEGVVDSFSVLQRRCPPGRSMEARGMDVWSTRYCLVASRAELLSLGRRMLRQPPLGTISLVGPSSNPEE